MSMYTIAARLATPPETWREIRPYVHPLRFGTEQAAQDWLNTNYPVTLQGRHYRQDAFHGLMQLRIVPVDE